MGLVHQSMWFQCISEQYLVFIYTLCIFIYETRSVLHQLMEIQLNSFPLTYLAIFSILIHLTRCPFAASSSTSFIKIEGM